MKLVTPEHFQEVARMVVLGMPCGIKKLSKKGEHQKFRSNFGTSFESCSDLWLQLEPTKKIKSSSLCIDVCKSLCK
jgi:hypothetical protein